MDFRGQDLASLSSAQLTALIGSQRVITRIRAEMSPVEQAAARAAFASGELAVEFIPGREFFASPVLDRRDSQRSTIRGGVAIGHRDEGIVAIRTAARSDGLVMGPENFESVFEGLLFRSQGVARGFLKTDVRWGSNRRLMLLLSVPALVSISVIAWQCLTFRATSAVMTAAAALLLVTVMAGLLKRMTPRRLSKHLLVDAQRMAALMEP